MKKILLALLILVIIAVLLVRWEKKNDPAVLSPGAGTVVENPQVSTPKPTVPIKQPPVKPVAKCYIGGCSNQICSDQPDVVSDCAYRDSYACYQGAKCERQASGQCGWTPTPALSACLAQYGE